MGPSLALTRFSRFLAAGVIGIAGLSVAISAPVAAGEYRREHALFGAVRDGDAALVESLLREGAPADVRATDGTTPLMLAARDTTAEIVELLLARGADPNAANDIGATALLWGAGDARTVELLLERGADVNARSALGNTPLMAAAAYPDGGPIVRRLLERGADVLAVNEGDNTPLLNAVYAGSVESVELLLERGGELVALKNLFGAGDASPLLVASRAGHAEIVGLLLERGADVNASDAGFSGHALNTALLAGKPAIARELIEKGADLAMKTPAAKAPPLLLAAYTETGDTSIARLLLEKGVDVASTDDSGATALTWARRRGFPDLIELLEKAGVPGPPDETPEIPDRQVNLHAGNRQALLREAAGRSIRLMQRSSDVFLDERGSCVSCHHQNLPGVALGWARDRGLEVDGASIRRMIDRQVRTWKSRTVQMYEMDFPVPVPPRFLGYGVWGFSALGYEADDLTDAVVRYLAAIQQPDGRWFPGVLRPPLGGGDVLSTALALRALRTYPPGGRRDEIAARVERAARWLAGAEPATHQERVYKLLGLVWAGAPACDLESEVVALRAAQRENGGWSQLAGIESDAYATGQSLVALHVAGGLPTTDPVYRRGIEFLLRTQFDDGSWFVKTRTWPFQPPFDSEFPFEKDQWISACATAWATMALVLVVEPTRAARLPSRDDDPDPVAVAGPAAPAGDEVASAPPVDPGEVDFARHIKPLLERSCAGCHGGEAPSGGFRVTAREALLRGGESGEAAIVPGRGTESRMVAFVSGRVEELEMPPLGKRDKFPPLTAGEIATLRAWIDGGAEWPEGVRVEPPGY